VVREVLSGKSDEWQGRGTEIIHRSERRKKESEHSFPSFGI